MKSTSSTVSTMLTTIAFALFSQLGHSATIYANSTTGSDGSGDGSSGNPYQSFHTAYTNASAGDIINLTGTFTWTDAGETGDATTSGYTISKNLTIQGDNAVSAVIRADETFNTADRRVYTVSSGVTVTFENLTIQNGKATYGGGIYSSVGGGTVNITINDCILSYNYAYDSFGRGGAVYFSSTSSASNLLMDQTTLEFNNSDGSSGAYGGAVYVRTNNSTTNEGWCRLTNCTFNNNYCDVWGGALYGYYASVEMTNCTFVDNTQWGNTVSFSYHGDILFTNCTIAYNDNNSKYTYATSGGLYFEGISGQEPTVYIKNTIVAQNTGGNGTARDWQRSSSSTLVDNGYNIIENQSGSDFTNGVNNNFVGTANFTLNLSSSLATNNSLQSTRTLALSSGSSAINAGNATANGSVSVPTTDQRNGTRNSTTDIGSFEFEASSGLPIELVSFDVVAIGNNALIQWETSSEFNNEKFQVYRSIDGKNWQLIAEREGAGNSTSTIHYEEMDARLMSGMYYYFLRQIDYDGKSTDSYVSSIEIIDDKILAYPNPSRSSIDLSVPIEGEYWIVDQLGKRIIQDYKSSSSTIDVSNLEPGMYFIQINNKSIPFSKLN